MGFDFKPEGPAADHVAMTLWVKGLKGGHSGLDIPLERGNSNKILFRFLYQVWEKYDIKLGPINGGSLRNAIPRESFATISIPASQAESLKKDLMEFNGVVKKEFSSADPGLETGIDKADMPVSFMDSDTAIRLIRTIYACPNGVMRMSTDMKGLVETSTNLAIVKTDGHQVRIQCLLRSSVDSAKEDLKNMFSSIMELAGGNIDFDGEYQGWKPDMNSVILKSSQEVYNKLFGKIPEIKAIHAGLECGILGGIYPNWDMISFGPTIRFPHSPDEKVNIETVGKFWDFLVGILEDAPTI
jgi:dipeptidase D